MMKERRINREERKRKKEKEKEKRRASANKRRRGPFGSCRAALLGSRRGLLKLDTVDGSSAVSDGESTRKHATTHKS